MQILGAGLTFGIEKINNIFGTGNSIRSNFSGNTEDRNLI